MHGLVFLGQASDDTIALRVHRPNNDYNSAIAEILAMIALGGNSGYLSFICAYLAVTYLIVYFETLKFAVPIPASVKARRTCRPHPSKATLQF